MLDTILKQELIDGGITTNFKYSISNKLGDSKTNSNYKEPQMDCDSVNCFFV